MHTSTLKQFTPSHYTQTPTPSHPPTQPCLFYRCGCSLSLSLSLSLHQCMRFLLPSQFSVFYRQPRGIAEFQPVVSATHYHCGTKATELIDITSCPCGVQQSQQLFFKFLVVCFYLTGQLRRSRFCRQSRNIWAGYFADFCIEHRSVYVCGDCKLITAFVMAWNACYYAHF